MNAPVTIREDECSVIEAAFREGYVQPRKFERNGKRWLLSVRVLRAWLRLTS